MGNRDPQGMAQHLDDVARGDAVAHQGLQVAQHLFHLARHGELQDALAAESGVTRAACTSIRPGADEADNAVDAGDNEITGPGAGTELAAAGVTSVITS